MNIQFQNQSFPFRPWTPAMGRVTDGPIAIDTETSRIDDKRPWLTPAFVLGAAFDGHTGYFLTRDNVVQFLAQHDNVLHIMHNAAFDLDVLQKMCPQRDIYHLVDRNLVHDTMLLHQLLTLAKEGHTGAGRGQATLEACAQGYLGVALPKSIQDADGDDVRLSYSKWLNRPPQDIERVYLDYLGRDVIATHQVFAELCRRLWATLSSASDSFGYVSLDWLRQCIERFGFQTHHIQLKASIVLRAITAAGLHIDVDPVGQLAKEVGEVANAIREELRTYGYVPGVQGNGRALQHILVEIERHNPSIRFPRTPTGKVETSADSLQQVANDHPFIGKLLEFRTLEKLSSTYLSKLNRQVLHPSFRTLVSTGRTSSYGDINAQNLPRDCRIRACFVPSPGHVFIDADYKAIEMATLAQTILTQFRQPSQLALALNRGDDPHRLLAAAMLDKMPIEVTSDERQKAKAINFGKPGGMGNQSLREYARLTYGVAFSEAEVSAISEAWFATYPEMRKYLESDINIGLEVAMLFGVTTAGLDHHLGRQSTDYLRTDSFAKLSMLGRMLLKVFTEESPASQAGKLYPEATIDYFWSVVQQHLNHLPAENHEDVRSRRPSFKLRRAIMSLVDSRGVFTLTGRLRGKARYCARRNCCFQGLAADGAKLALWKLWRAGFRIVNFIHDEVLVEVPADSDLTLQASDIQRLMIDGMQEVVPDIRIDVNFAAMDRWHKGAEPIFNAEGRLQLWQPQAVAVQV